MTKINSEVATLSPALLKAQEARKRMKDLGIEPERLNPIEKALKNPKSLRAAINGKCWDCVGAGADPNPRKLIRKCECGKNCPLYPVRPYQKKVDDDDTE